jgi:hypothetical protein
MPACRLAAVRNAVASKLLTEPSRLRYCEWPDCYAMLATLPGARLTRTCTKHAGQRPPEESDAEKAERVRVLFGWQKPRRDR